MQRRTMLEMLAGARELPALEGAIRNWLAQGYRYVSVQVATLGVCGYGVGGATRPTRSGGHASPPW